MNTLPSIVILRSEYPPSLLTVNMSKCLSRITVKNSGIVVSSIFQRKPNSLQDKTHHAYKVHAAYRIEGSVPLFDDDNNKFTHHFVLLAGTPVYLAVSRNCETVGLFLSCVKCTMSFCCAAKSVRQPNKRVSPCCVLLLLYKNSK